MPVCSKCPSLLLYNFLWLPPIQQICLVPGQLEAFISSLVHGLLGRKGQPWVAYKSNSGPAGCCSVRADGHMISVGHGLWYSYRFLDVSCMIPSIIFGPVAVSTAL